MAISSTLPSSIPFPVSAPTSRGPVPSVTGSDTRDMAESRQPETARATDEAAETRGDRGERSPSVNARDKTAQPEGQLDDGQLKQLRELKARDREVRAHEQAHQAVGGQYAGAVSYTYQRGPDGNQYAVGGEVSIDIAPVEGDPQATIEKMRKVRAAALAPAEPSGQDRAVAAQAMQLMLQAQVELSESAAAGGSDSADREPGRARSISASNAYQSVSGMVEPTDEGARFRASA